MIIIIAICLVSFRKTEKYIKEDQNIYYIHQEKRH